MDTSTPCPGSPRHDSTGEPHQTPPPHGASTPLLKQVHSARRETPAWKSCRGHPRPRRRPVPRGTGCTRALRGGGNREASAHRPPSPRDCAPPKGDSTCPQRGGSRRTGRHRSMPADSCQRYNSSIDKAAAATGSEERAKLRVFQPQRSPGPRGRGSWATRSLGWARGGGLQLKPLPVVGPGLSCDEGCWRGTFLGGRATWQEPGSPQRSAPARQPPGRRLPNPRSDAMTHTNPNHLLRHVVEPSARSSVKPGCPIRARAPGELEARRGKRHRTGARRSAPALRQVT